MEDRRLVVRLPSRRDPSTLYEIRALSAGGLTCDCPGYTHSKRKSCRHIEIVEVARVIAGLMAPP
jgi:hypothetical protein